MHQITHDLDDAEIPTKQYAFTTRSTIAPKCLMTGDLICEDLNNCVKCVGSAPKKVCSDQAGAFEQRSCPPPIWSSSPR